MLVVCALGPVECYGLVRTVFCTCLLGGRGRGGGVNSTERSAVGKNHLVV